MHEGRISIRNYLDQARVIFWPGFETQFRNALAIYIWRLIDANFTTQLKFAVHVEGCEILPA